MAESQVETLSLAGRIDAACDRFEAEWRAGARPRIEDFLADVGEKESPHWLLALVRLEFELRGESGIPLETDSFVLRFPSHEQLVRDAEAGSGEPIRPRAAIPGPDELRRAKTLLPHKAQLLEAEIAHRQKVEKALARCKGELAGFLENAHEGLHRLSADGTILWANNAALAMLGYEENECIGRPVAEFHVDREVSEDMLTRLRRGENLHDHSARLRCKDGSIRHVRLHSHAHFDAGKFLYSSLFIRDVTEQWRAEEALRDADLRNRELLATLAHELRNPLAPLCNSLQILRLTEDLPPVVQEVSAIIDRQARQLVRLVDELLELSRIASGRIELRKQPVEMAPLVADAVATSRPRIDAARHQLSVSGGAGQESESVVHLPVAPGVVRSSVTATTSGTGRAPVATRRILIVDDNRIAGHILGKLLEKLGQQVRSTDGAASALEAVRVERPDVAICDIGMPTVDGYELARRLRRDPALQGIVLVALTGFGQDSDRQRAREAGFDHYLVKPVSLDSLEKLLASLAVPA